MAVAFPTPETVTSAHLGAIVNLFELSTDLLATVGPDGRLRELSPAWQATLGWTREELTAKPFIELVHPDDRESTAQIASNAGIAGSEAFHFENRFLHRDGSWRRLLWSARSDGETLYAVAKDVTERKRLERPCWWPPRGGSRPRCGPATPWDGSAATSSW